MLFQKYFFGDKKNWRWEIKKIVVAKGALTSCGVVFHIKTEALTMCKHKQSIRSISLSYSLSLSYTLSPSISYSLTLSLSHTHTHTHIHAVALWYFFIVLFNHNISLWKKRIWAVVCSCVEQPKIQLNCSRMIWITHFLIWIYPYLAWCSIRKDSRLSFSNFVTFDIHCIISWLSMSTVREYSTVRRTVWYGTECVSVHTVLFLNFILLIGRN